LDCYGGRGIGDAMNEELVLKPFAFTYFPESFGFGIHLQWSLWNKNDNNSTKVRWLFLSFSFICWSIEFRFPLKIYGIRK